MAAVGDGLPRGAVARFERQLAAAPRAEIIWREKIWPACSRWRAVFLEKEGTGKAARAGSDAKELESHDLRDAVRAAFAALGKSVTPEKLTHMLDIAAERGDANALRLLAGIAGVDLSPEMGNRKVEPAIVIVLEPFDEEIRAEYERRIRAGEIACPCGAAAPAAAGESGA